jgi:hypothetical protein
MGLSATHTGRFHKKTDVAILADALGFALLAWVYLISPTLKRSRAYKVIKLKKSRIKFTTAIQRCNLTTPAICKVVNLAVENKKHHSCF